MKLTPLLLFLLLLVVLVIAVITLKQPTPPVDQEGFVNFQTTVIPQREVKVPPYSSRSIVKMYDNIFFDRQNANIVEVCSSEFTGNVNLSNYTATGGNVDLTGKSITSINVQTRDGTLKNYPVKDGGATVETPESQVANINSSYKTIPYYTTSCENTGKYQLFYIPWNKDTYVHAIQNEPTPLLKSQPNFKPNHLFTYYIPQDTTGSINATIYTNNAITLANSSAPDNSDKNNTYVIEPLYSSTNKVYQLSSDVKYDVKNGNVIVNYPSDKSIMVYDRNGVNTKYTVAPDSGILANSVPTVAYAPWVKNNSSNTIQILYVQNKTNTLVCLFQTDTSNRFKMINYGRFTSSDIDKGDSNTITGEGSGGPPVPDPSKLSQSAISDYYKWYWYWNSNSTDASTKYTDNYLLKTQIVPPVCPACPITPVTKCASEFNNDANKDKKDNVVVAAAVGAAAGANAASSKNKDDGNVITKTVDATGNVVTKTVDTAGNIVTKTVDAVGNIITETVDTAGKIIDKTINATTNLITSGAEGTVGLVKSGASGTADLLYDTGSGAAGIVNNAIDTTGNVLGNLSSGGYAQSGYAQPGYAQTGYAQPGYAQPGYAQPGYAQPGYSAPGFSQGSPPIDNYSYYGAMPPKGNNYIPITADFSAFGR